jgi:hypothetical protein
MAFSYKTTSTPVKGKKFTDLLKDVRQATFKDSQEFADKLRKEVEIQIDDSTDFLTKLDISLDKLKQIGFEDILDKGQQSELSKRLRQLRSTIGEKTVYQLDHITMAPINQTLSLLIINLVKVIDNAEGALQIGVTGSGIVPRDLYGLGMTRAPSATRNPRDTAGTSISGLKVVVDELREVRAFGEAIENTFAQKGPKGMTPSNLEKAYQALQTNGVLDITEIKEKDVGLRDGEIAKIKIETKSDHKDKSDWQAVEGILKTTTTTGGDKLDLDAKTLEKVNEAKRIILNNKPTEILGSKAIEQQLGEQFADVFKGKKPKRTKTSSKKTTSQSFAKKSLKQGRTTNKTSSKLDAIATAVSTARIKRKGDDERDSGSIQRELNKLKTAINRRLPAEVRRNMGRPALINQTGRFSNSAELLNLRQAAKTVVGNYTYQLNPYETFENTGRSRWPVGYNPKPLIAKSIRNLAEQISETKFTFTLRRT